MSATSTKRLPERSYECFKVEIAEGIAHIILDRPRKMNAMNRAFWRELPAIVREIDDGALARVIVISSTGKHFTAGMDLSVFTSGPDMKGKETGRLRANLMRTVLKLQKTFGCLDEARMPVLMAVQGAASAAASISLLPATCATARKTLFSAFRKSTSA